VGGATLPSGLLGSPFKNNGNLGYGFLLPEEVFAQEVVQDLSRLISSAKLNWTPAEWFTGRATFGLDNTARHDQYFAPVGQVPLGTTFLGSRTSNRVQTFVYTVDGGGTASFQVTPDISSRSSAGVQYLAFTPLDSPSPETRRHVPVTPKTRNGHAHRLCPFTSTVQ
jgi:hypothetical protein